MGNPRPGRWVWRDTALAVGACVALLMAVALFGGVPAMAQVAFPTATVTPGPSGGLRISAGHAEGCQATSQSCVSRAMSGTPALALGTSLARAPQPAVAADTLPAGPVTFVVDSTGDSATGCDGTPGTACTLRAAILRANAHGYLNTIAFAIGSGLQTIVPTSPLPTITNRVIIDGTTQPGYSGSPLIELSGTAVTTPTAALAITAGGSTVRGLIINRFGTMPATCGAGFCVGDSALVLIVGGANTIQGNYIGTTADGESAAGNNGNGIYISSANNLIGGVTPAARNVISANGLPGVTTDGFFTSSDNNTIEGNYIGTDATGTRPLGNLNGGIYIANGDGNVIGGTSGVSGTSCTGACNVIAGTQINSSISPCADQLALDAGSSDGLVQGNFIGTDVTGTVKLGNAACDALLVLGSSFNTIGGTNVLAQNLIDSGATDGVHLFRASNNTVEGNLIGVDSSGVRALGNGRVGVSIDGTTGAATNNVVGGTSSIEGNLISGNVGDGVRIVGANAIANFVQANTIGTTEGGLGRNPLPNQGSGVSIVGGAAENTIGGASAGLGNTIAFSGVNGIGLSADAGFGNAILGNSIYSNTKLGIDLGDDGVTPNVMPQGTAGPNAHQNFPVITSIDTSAGITVSGTLDSSLNSTYRLEFFKSPSCSPVWYGQGQLPLGSTLATTDAFGHASFQVNLAGSMQVGDFITATATNVANNNTSEFSRCRGLLNIENVEFTQAIQTFENVATLQGHGMQGPDVPIVAFKPMAMRVMLSKISTPTDAIVEYVEHTDNSEDAKPIDQPASCSPNLQRTRTGGCQSTDFYFVPGALVNMTVNVQSATGEPLDSQSFTFNTVQVRPINMFPLSVCDANSGGEFDIWFCGSAGSLLDLLGFLRSTAPTSSIGLGPDRGQVDLDQAGYASRPAFDWWEAAANEIQSLARENGDATLGNIYYGMLRNPGPPTGIGGIAAEIPSNAAMSLHPATDLNREDDFETLAHETGHALGLHHTNLGAPQAGVLPPGCWTTAEDSGTDWPYADQTIQEVGFDLTGTYGSDPAKQILLPSLDWPGHIAPATFDWMSYCAPRWISPFTYKKLLQTLTIPSASTSILPALAARASDLPSASAPHAVEMVAASTGSAAPLLAAAPTGSFWNIHGVLSTTAATIAPIFQLTASADTTAGSGAYRIDVQDINGTILFTRFFSPTELSADPTSGGGSTVFGLGFAEMVPVQSSAATIVVRDPSNATLASVDLTGPPPSVSMIFPVGGETLSGLQIVSWTASSPAASPLTYRVQYSHDGGVTWTNLSTGQSAQALQFNFDTLGGSVANSLIRVLASDGAHTAIASSSPFSVPQKSPQPKITAPGSGATFTQHDLVWLQGEAFDPQDGFLSGTALQWTSSLDGLLGTGDSLPLTRLSVGSHTITLSGTDSSGNAASASISITVASRPVIATPTPTSTPTPGASPTPTPTPPPTSTPTPSPTPTLTPTPTLAPFAAGEPFAASFGKVNLLSRSGSVLGTMDTTLSNVVDANGICFDSSGDLYVVSNDFPGSISKFDSSGHLLMKNINPNPGVDGFYRCDVDSAGNLYVSGTGTPLFKFNSSGTLLGTQLFFPGQDTPGIALASDGCTLLNAGNDTNGSDVIRRFNVCTGAQLTDFGSGIPAAQAIGPATCSDVRIRSNGEVFVACQGEVVRFSAAGDVLQIYSNPREDFFEISLDPDGATFWAIGRAAPTTVSHNVYHIDITSGAGINAQLFTLSTPGFPDRNIALAVFGSPAPGANTWVPQGTCDCTQVVAGGDNDTCALAVGGVAECWGSSGFGELGNGTYADHSRPVEVVGLGAGVKSISPGGDHVCAVTASGGVKCWGFGASGELGDGAIDSSLTPIDVSGLSSGVVAVSSSPGNFQTGGYTCALTSGGAVQCWGAGFGLTPVTIPGWSSGVAAVSSGTATCALLTTGGAQCFGPNSFGEVGDGTTTSRSSPVNVQGLTSGVVAISAGQNHTCAVTAAGGAKCWGFNGTGQLGDGTTVNRSAPVDVSGLTSGVVAISAGSRATCALSTAGGVKCWGWNGEGEVGDGTTTERNTPVDVIGLTSGVSSVSAGAGSGGAPHACALLAAGNIKCWGRDVLGELGDGTTSITDRLVPVDVICPPLTTPPPLPTATPTPTPTSTPTATPTSTVTPTPTTIPTSPPSCDQTEPNVALASNGGSVVAVSSNFGGSWDVSNLIDGSATSGWATNQFHSQNQLVIVQLGGGGTFMVDHVCLNPAATNGDPAANGVQLFHVAAAQELVAGGGNGAPNGTFTTVYSGTAPMANGLFEYQFPPVAARYVMLVVDTNYGGRQIEAAELGVYGTAITSATPTVTPTVTPSVTPTPTVTPTVTPSVTPTPVVDAVPPSCAISAVGVNSLNQRYIQVTVQDAQDGVASISATTVLNMSVQVGAYASGITLAPTLVTLADHPTAPVIITATRVNSSLSAQLALKVADVAGNITTCDPILTEVGRDNGMPRRETFLHVAGDESLVTVYNDRPGLTRLTLIVDGRRLEINALKEGEVRTVDASELMRRRSDNTVTIEAEGKPGGSATVVLWGS